MNTQKKNNLKIGSFQASETGDIYGTVHGLGMGATPVVFATQFGKDGRIYYRLIAETETAAFEIGVAFPKDKNGLLWYAVTIDSPMFPAPISAALFGDRDKKNYNLVWSREDQSSPKVGNNSEPFVRPTHAQLTPA